MGIEHKAEENYFYENIRDNLNIRDGESWLV